MRVWYSEKNFGRRDRAIELAKKLGKSPIHVALAYVLAQPFPSVPLIGPRTLDELDDSLKALDIRLSAADLAWLDGGRGEGARGGVRFLARRLRFAPPSVLPDISPARGEIGSVEASPSSTLQDRRLAEAPISPLAGEMSGRTEGGATSAGLSDTPALKNQSETSPKPF